MSINQSRLRTIASRPDVIFHLAGVVSGEAEADFDKGYRVNFDGTGLVALTEADGTHTVNYSPDREFFVDQW